MAWVVRLARSCDISARDAEAVAVAVDVVWELVLSDAAELMVSLNAPEFD
jgi:hypothetical protein